MINRALIYAALTTGVISVYVLVVGYLGWLFRTEGNLTLSLIATGLIAVGFAPARQLVQRGVNRLLYGERDEPYRVLWRLGQQLETAAAPSVVLAQAAETLARSLKWSHAAACWLNIVWALVLAPLVIGIIQRMVIEKEERYLEQQFGELCRQYKAHVRRWI